MLILASLLFLSIAMIGCCAKKNRIALEGQFYFCIY